MLIHAFVVVCISEREVEQVVFCDTLEAACEEANGLLKKHIDTLECVEDRDFDNGVDEEVEWGKATPATLNAWCNYDSYHWDAHIVSAAGDIPCLM